MLNPDFAPIMERRRAAQSFNRDATGMKVPVPKQPNRYLPHTGAKERARHTGKATLGFNASRALPTDDNPGVLSSDRNERVGQTVKWLSSAKYKTGQIIAVVPAGSLPRDVLTDAPAVKDATSPRDHVSYVVQVGKTRYWPRVSLLNFV